MNDFDPGVARLRRLPLAITPHAFSGKKEKFLRHLAALNELLRFSSMITMRERKISEVLTHDRPFAQEGFTLLF